MKKLLTLAALCTAFVASAASLTVTFPNTPLSDASTLGGTFTYDTVTNNISAINITAAGNALAGSYTILGNNRSSPDQFFYARKTGDSGTELGKPLVLIFFNGPALPPAGAFTLPQVAIGTCLNLVGADCVNINPYAGQASNVAAVVGAITPAPVAATSIPTLSEWGLILTASLVGMIAMLRMRKRR